MGNLQQFMGGRMGMGAPTTTPAAPTTQEPPETRFAAQLTQLEAMGFTNRAANIEALTRTGGELNAAVDRLVQGPP